MEHRLIFFAPQAAPSHQPETEGLARERLESVERRLDVQGAKKKVGELIMQADQQALQNNEELRAKLLEAGGLEYTAEKGVELADNIALDELNTEFAPVLSSLGLQFIDNNGKLELISAGPTTKGEALEQQGKQVFAKLTAKLTSGDISGALMACFEVFAVVQEFIKTAKDGSLGDLFETTRSKESKNRAERRAKLRVELEQGGDVKVVIKTKKEEKTKKEAEVQELKGTAIPRQEALIKAAKDDLKKEQSKDSQDDRVIAQLREEIALAEKTLKDLQKTLVATEAEVQALQVSIDEFSGMQADVKRMQQTLQKSLTAAGSVFVRIPDVGVKAIGEQISRAEVTITTDLKLAVKANGKSLYTAICEALTNVGVTTLPESEDMGLGENGVLLDSAKLIAYLESHVGAEVSQQQKVAYIAAIETVNETVVDTKTKELLRAALRRAPGRHTAEGNDCVYNNGSVYIQATENPLSVVEYKVEDGTIVIINHSNKYFDGLDVVSLPGEDSEGEVEPENSENLPLAIEDLRGLQIVIANLSPTSGEDYILKVNDLLKSTDADIVSLTSNAPLTTQQQEQLEHLQNIASTLRTTIEKQRKINILLEGVHNGDFGVVTWIPGIGVIFSGNSVLADMFGVKDATVLTVDEFSIKANKLIDNFKNKRAEMQSQAHKKLSSLHVALNERLSMIVSREQATINGALKNRGLSGWFGGLSRFVTRSDPYQLDINLANQKISIVNNVTRPLLNEAKNALNNNNLQLAKRKLDAVARSIKTFNKVDLDTERYEVEQEALTVTRDVSIATIVTVATLGGGAVGSVGTRAATAQSFRSAILSGATISSVSQAGMSTATGIDDVQRGVASVEEAWLRGAGEVGGAFVAGALTAGLFKGVSAGTAKVWNRLRAGRAKFAPSSGSRQGPKQSTGSQQSGPRAAENPNRSTSGTNSRSGTEAKAKSSSESTGSRQGRGSDSSQGKAAEPSGTNKPNQNPNTGPAQGLFDPLKNKVTERMSVAEFLGVDKNATSDVMLKAVRIMMRRLHPDKHSGSFADTIRDNFELAGIIKKLLREAPKKIRPTSFVKWLE